MVKMEYWKFKAIDKLRGYSAQKAALVSLPEEIARLESEAYSIKSATSDGTPVKGGGSGREDRLLSNITNRDEHKLMLERAQKSVSSIERGLSVLDKTERRILEMVYVHPEEGAVRRLMEEFCLVEASSVYKRINKALVHFTMAMYGGTES